MIEDYMIYIENAIDKKPKKKKPISAAIKRLVWNTHIGEDIGKHKCLCCKTTDITQMSFNCGHIIAEANGGEAIVSNLKPICQNCNSSMGTRNMNDFMKSFK
jgi:5-methylcytosine-specific restriction endonuclease McrA